MTTDEAFDALVRAQVARRQAADEGVRPAQAAVRGR